MEQKLLRTILLLPSFLMHLCIASQNSSSSPHIILFIADDLGFNDVGYQNPIVITPNIDKLAADGVILDRNYVQPVCTPTRSALMTGMYPYKIGRQGVIPLQAYSPTGLTLNYTIMPQLLKQQGYATHMVGKWHLGNCKPEYTPFQRGFDSHFGFMEGGQDYYTKSARGVRDFFLNNEPYGDLGEYSLELYTSRMREIIRSHDASSEPLFLYAAMQNVHTPLQVPKKYEDMYSDMDLNPNRRTYLGMVTAMDEMLGNIVDELQSKGMYENSIIIFSSDNGGQSLNGGASNLPLRGNKGTYYEGGVRVPAFVHSPSYVKNPGRIYDKLVHVTDWLPTLLSLTDSELEEKRDGINQFNAIFENDQNETPRKMVVNDLAEHTLVGRDVSKGAIQFENGWKLLHNQDREILFDHYSLYNVVDDPNETEELSSVYPDLLEELKSQYEELLKEMVPEDKPPQNPLEDITDGNGNLSLTWCTDEK